MANDNYQKGKYRKGDTFMPNCENCGKPVENDDVYEVNNRKLCEGCAIEGSSLNSPSRPCGPNS